MLISFFNLNGYYDAMKTMLDTMVTHDFLEAETAAKFLFTDDNLVKSARKVKILTDKVIGEIDFSEYDMLVMPGGPGTGNYFKSQLLLDNVLKFSKDTENKRVAAICAAPTVLASLGILEGKNAVCFPACVDDLLKGKAILKKERAVVDGNIITSRSAGTAMDFSLAIIGELLGKEAAERIAKEIVL